MYLYIMLDSMLHNFVCDWIKVHYAFCFMYLLKIMTVVLLFDMCCFSFEMCNMYFSSLISSSKIVDFCLSI